MQNGGQTVVCAPGQRNCTVAWIKKTGQNVHLKINSLSFYFQTTKLQDTISFLTLLTSVWGFCLSLSTQQAALSSKAAYLLDSAMSLWHRY